MRHNRLYGFTFYFFVIVIKMYWVCQSKYALFILDLPRMLHTISAQS